MKGVYELLSQERSLRALPLPACFVGCCQRQLTCILLRNNPHSAPGWLQQFLPTRPFFLAKLSELYKVNTGGVDAQKIVVLIMPVTASFPRSSRSWSF